MMTNNKDIWISAGYKTFAFSGQAALKIEPLAKQVGKNKSSFYHHFADLELYTEELLKYHLKQAKVIAEKEQKARNINPELIDILVEHGTDILFNRQLRINSADKKFLKVLEKSNEIVGNDFVLLWVRDLDLKISQRQLEGIFELALDNFYLRVTAENLSHQWLSDYFDNLKKIVKNIIGQN